MYAGRPIIGIAGGIGSGKSYVAALFGELGCAVIDSDAQVRAAYDRPDVRAALREWWGDAAFLPDGRVSRSAIAAKVFHDPAERARLEALLHPLVAAARDDAMRHAVQGSGGGGGDAKAAGPVAFVWDTPLLFETGLYRQCDALVFVDAPEEVRLSRVRGRRGWDEHELRRREILQWPLDRKRELSDDVVTNTAGADVGGPGAGDGVRDQVRQVLSRILARSTRRTGLQ